MRPGPTRLLVVAGDDPALLALQDYFTFRGYLVDSSGDLDDARALVRHVCYAALVVSGGALGATTAGVRELAGDLHSRCVGARLVMVADHDAPDGGVDAVVRRDQPISQLARTVRQAIGVAARSA